MRRVYATEGERRCERLRGVLPGEEKDEDAGEASGESHCALRVPNSSPSNQSCCCTLVLMVDGGGWLSFSSRGEPTRRGGIGGSLRFEGSWRREREEMRRGKAGREGRGDGTRGGEGMRGGGTQRDMQVQYRQVVVRVQVVWSSGQRAEDGTAGERAWAAEEDEGGCIYRSSSRRQKKGACVEGRESAIRAVKGRRAVWHYPSDSDAHAARFGRFDFGLHSKRLESSNKRRQRMLRSPHLVHLVTLTLRAPYITLYHPPEDSLDCAQGAPTERILRGRGHALAASTAAVLGE